MQRLLAGEPVPVGAPQLPTSDLKGDGKGCRAACDSGQKEPRAGDRSARSRRQPLQMWARPCGGAFRQEPLGGCEAAQS